MPAGLQAYRRRLQWRHVHLAEFQSSGVSRAMWEAEVPGREPSTAKAKLGPGSCRWILKLDCVLTIRVPGLHADWSSSLMQPTLLWLKQPSVQETATNNRNHRLRLARRPRPVVPCGYVVRESPPQSGKQNNRSTFCILISRSTENHAHNPNVPLNFPSLPRSPFIRPQNVWPPFGFPLFG